MKGYQVFHKSYPLSSRGVLQKSRSEDSESSQSKILPRCQISPTAHFCPCGDLVGECLPQTLLNGYRRKFSSRSVWQFCHLRCCREQEKTWKSFAPYLAKPLSTMGYVKAIKPNFYAFSKKFIKENLLFSEICKKQGAKTPKKWR